MSKNPQPSILPAGPRVARYLTFSFTPDSDPAKSKAAIQALDIDDTITVGIGEPLIEHWGGHVDGLRAFPHDEAPFGPRKNMLCAITHCIYLSGRKGFPQFCVALSFKT